MSEIERLRRFIEKNPALQNTPFIIVGGRPMSPREALESLQAGILTDEICDALREVLGSPPITLETLYLLAEEHYRRMMLVPKPWPQIIWIGDGFTYDKALEEVRLRSPKGEEIALSYQSLLNEVRRRLHG